MLYRISGFGDTTTIRSKLARCVEVSFINPFWSPRYKKHLVTLYSNFLVNHGVNVVGNLSVATTTVDRYSTSTYIEFRLVVLPTLSQRETKFDSLKR